MCTSHKLTNQSFHTLPHSLHQSFTPNIYIKFKFISFNKSREQKIQITECFILDTKTKHIFGSKAKLPASEADILELATNESDYYLSEVDESPKRLCSAIVRAPKPAKINSVPVTKAERQHQKHRLDTIEPRGFSHSQKRAHTRVERHRGATLKPRVFTAELNSTATQSNQKTFETRGTQTERVGPCKCARAIQAKNQRRRLDNKKNKQLIEALAKHHHLPSA